jgi:chromosome segregation ATPase
MKKDLSQPQEIEEVDLDKTDRLPILEGSFIEDDAAEDAVPLDNSLTLPSGTLSARTTGEFHRPQAMDLPTLAENIRSVEERIARQHAEYETLKRSFELAREAAQASEVRAATLTAELAAARSAQEAEQQRSRQLEARLAETGASVETARARTDEVLRESERHQSESHLLRESLAAREASMTQVLHSLGERDAQLASLQKEYAKLSPELETRTQAGRQLESELQAALERIEALKAELADGKASLATQGIEFKRSEAALQDARRELGSTKSLAASFLERLRTREFRRGISQNVYRELDDQVTAATAARDALVVEHEQLKQQLAEREARLVSQDATIAQLNGSIASGATALSECVDELQRTEDTRAQLAEQLSVAKAELGRLAQELSTRDAAVAAARAEGSEEARRALELLAAAEKQQAELGAQVTELQSESQTADQEMTVLMAHLQEARRPIESIQADVRRLTDELAAKTQSFEEQVEDNKSLRATLERTRGALEEREFLIRRLERAETNNANALGRIQTSMERLGAAVPSVPPVGTPPQPDVVAELIRMDGDRPVTHALGRRTRIGRSQTCELRIDSTSVSRHHALIMAGPLEVIIEDLNSTNGVIVNGRKVSRQVLRDGDAVTIGEVQFRFVAIHPSQPPQSGGQEPGGA